MITVASSLLLALTCVVQHPDGMNKAPVGMTSGTGSLMSGRPCIGVAKMYADGTLEFVMNDDFMVGRQTGFTRSKYKPGQVGYKEAVDMVGGIAPGEEKPVPPSPPSIGVAKMDADGTLTVQFRMVSANNAVGEGLLVIKPDDPKYRAFVDHIGIKPGELKPVPPWEKSGP